MKQYLILFFLLLLTACGGTGVSDQLDGIDGYVDNNPQAALEALASLDIGNVKSRESKAHYSLLYSKALDKCYIDTTDVSVVADAVDWYSRHGSPDEKMQSFYYLGRIHGNAGRYTESILALTRALEEGKPSADLKYKGRIYIAMADAYNNTYNVVEEGRCVDQALEYFKESGDSLLLSGATYRKAISCLNLGDYEQSNSLFQSLLSIKDLRPSLRAKCLVKYAYLLALTDNPDNKRTLSLFQEAINAGAEFSERDAAAYAYILWSVGDTTDSDYVYGEIEQRDSSMIGMTSAWKGRIKEKQGRYREAYNYLNKAVEFQSEGVDYALRQSLSIVQRDYYSAVAGLQEAKAENHKKISRMTGVASITIIILLLVLGWNILMRNKERTRQSLSDLEHFKEKMKAVQKTVDDKESQIVSLQAQFQNVFQEHFRLLAQLYETYDMNLRRGTNDKTTYMHIQGVFKAIRGEEETDHWFEKIIDRDMDGLISSFRSDFPKLKELDYQLFCYYVAGYDTKTISIILSERSADSLYMRKSRIKKVIEESDVKDKERYLRYF